MRDVLYLAWRYLAFNRGKTAVLVASLMLIVFLPSGLKVLVGQSAAELTARARSTPLLVGAKGSALELVLNSLYFESDPPEVMSYEEVARIDQSNLADAIPLSIRFRARGRPIVATSIEYFGFRGSTFLEGRAMAVLGECVIGAEVAATNDLHAGDSIISSPESVFDIAGVYPLKMRIAGVLAPSYTPDDRAVFVDIKTGWVIEGLGHGHQDLTASEAAAGVLSRTDSNVVGNAAVVQYNEITPDNITDFHFHGGTETFPITAVIAVPHDRKSGVILMGRYELADGVQIVTPATVMDQLLDTVLTVQTFVVAGMMVVGIATLATAVLVFVLSLRIRKREIETMVKIGGSRSRIAAILTLEIVIVFVLAAGLAGALTMLVSRFGSLAVRLFMTG